MSAIAIVDRSVLSHNLFRLVLKPKGFSCYCVETLEQLKKLLSKKTTVKGIFVNVESEASWWRQEGAFVSIPKIFFCNEEKQKEMFSKIPSSCVLLKPFHPSEVTLVVEQWL